MIFQKLMKKLRKYNYVSNRKQQASSIMSKANTTAGSATAKATSKIGRNETCPCGSGKKFKRCHGSDT